MAKSNGKLLIGTAKGAFILDRKDGKWSIDGPHFAGRSVYAMMFDQPCRERPHLGGGHELAFRRRACF